MSSPGSGYTVKSFLLLGTTTSAILYILANTSATTMPSFDSYYTVKSLFVLGTTTSAILSGCLLFSSFQHVPAYVKNSSDESLLNQWQTMAAIGRKTLPPLALIASGAHFLNSYITYTQPQYYRFMAAGMLSLAILPYTFMVLRPTNFELLSREKKMKDSPDYGLGHLSVKELFTQWGNLSVVRGYLLLASTIVSCDAMLHLTF